MAALGASDAAGALGAGVGALGAGVGAGVPALDADGALDVCVGSVVLLAEAEVDCKQNRELVTTSLRVISQYMANFGYHFFSCL